MPICFRRRYATALLAFAALAASGFAHSQVQRSFINLGFEDTTLTAANAANGCYVQVSDPQVPGWTTNHPLRNGTGDCTSPPAVTNSALIELWRTNFQGVPAREGVNFAELNAEAASRMSQSVCLVNGEDVRYQLSHRGRNGTDVMSFNIDSTANTILRGSTTNAGAGTVVAGSCGSGSISAGVCNAPVTTNTWGDYTGRFTWNGSSALHSFGFEAISSAGGNVTVGNFLDRIQVFLAPYIELASTTGSGRESIPTASVPTLMITGAVPTALTINLAVNPASTATLGSDFTTSTGTATFSVTIPAGNYDGGTTSRFPLGITIANDTVIEDNETIVIDLVPNPANYTIASTRTCGGTANSRISYTILDDDVDLLTTKTASNASPPPGGTTQFTVTYANNTARPSAGDVTTHDAVATIADPVPTGLTFTTWTCSASGGATCPAASGSGAINASATLPAGIGGGAGGTLTYTITATLDATSCTAVTNTSTVTAVAPVAEGASAQSGFTTPAPGGTANNTASTVVTPACADLSITKTNNATSVVSGSTVSYTIVVANAGPSAANGAIVRDPVPTGLTCTTATCGAPVNGAVCPAATGAALLTALQSAGGVAVPTLPSTGSVTFTVTCTVN